MHTVTNEGRDVNLRSIANVVVVRVLAIAALPHFLAVVLIGSELGLDVSLNEIVHVEDVLGAILARLLTRTGHAAVGGAQLEVHEALLVQAIVVLAIVVVVVIVIVVVVVLTAKVSTVVLVRHGALLELDGVANDPVGVLVVVVLVVETTRRGEDAAAQGGRGGDVVGGNLDGLAGGADAQGGEEGDGAEVHDDAAVIVDTD